MQGNIVTVVQKGKLMNIAEDTLCVGDMVVLQAGELVPADLNLVEGLLKLDEFDLTGEIVPIIKTGSSNEEVRIYKGSRIISGRGKGIVVATGTETEYNKSLKQLWEVEEDCRSPSVNKWTLGLLTLLPLLAAIALLSLKWRAENGIVFILCFFTAAVILVLHNSEIFRSILVSRKIKELEGRHIYIRDRKVLERILDTDVVCFDKTGVLTTRHMEVRRIHSAEGWLDEAAITGDRGQVRLINLACVLCNEVDTLEYLDRANPIDRALIAFAAKNGMNFAEIAPGYKRIEEKPFNSEERYMSCGFVNGNQNVYFAKGDPEVILKMCSNYHTAAGAKQKIDAAFISFLTTALDRIKQSGDIAIALASGLDIRDKSLREYSFLCLAHLANPLQPGVCKVINKIKKKGLRIFMLTGDRAETAVKIGVAAGIEQHTKTCLTGKDIAGMGLAAIARLSNHVSIFARLLPSQKGVIIRALQQKGCSVIMLGDGANDTIALKVADIGISFVEDSSPIAKRISRVLVDNIVDLLHLIQGAESLRKKVKYTTFFLRLLLIILFLGIYSIWR